jgi:hypothetical protein
MAETPISGMADQYRHFERIDLLASKQRKLPSIGHFFWLAGNHVRHLLLVGVAGSCVPRLGTVE